MARKKVTQEFFDVYNFVLDFPNQIRDAYFLQEIPKVKMKYNRIVVIGMGGSYIGGLVLQEFLRDDIDIPIEVFPGEMPVLDERTLVILISYSGNTKELLSLLPKMKNQPMLIVTSGGKLLDRAKRKKIPFIHIQESLHPRFTFSYGFFPVLRFLENQGKIESFARTVDKIIRVLKKNRVSIEEEARHLATKTKKPKQLLFYASNYFYPVAYRFQTSIEEDAKIVCHANKITELFHNELEAFPNNKAFCVVVYDPREMKPYKRQMRYFKKLIESHEIRYVRYPREIRMFLLFYFVDFYGYYLSRLKHTPMGETPLSDRIKKL